jgi:hypothetical protein
LSKIQEQRLGFTPSPYLENICIPLHDLSISAKGGCHACSMLRDTIETIVRSSDLGYDFPSLESTVSCTIVIGSHRDIAFRVQNRIQKGLKMVLLLDREQFNIELFKPFVGM